MKTQVEACRESCSESYRTAHISGCIAAIVVMTVFAGAKLGYYLPVSMSSLRIMLFPLLAYVLVGAGMLWNLGRSIKRAKIADELVLMAADVPPLL